MTMIATVLRVNPRNLLVMDSEFNQEVMVHFGDTRRFSSGDRIRITFNGQMTQSIPPQITATSIQRIQGPPQSTPAETRAVILRINRNSSLLVRDLSNNRQLLVHSPHARHYCPGQRIIIRYNSIVMNNPPEINATDINPLC